MHTFPKEFKYTVIFYFMYIVIFIYIHIFIINKYFNYFNLKY